jgi:hypothetical protein
LAAVGNGALVGGLSALRSLSFEVLNDVQTFHNFSKDDVLVVEPFRLHGSDEELRSIGVGTGVGHGEHSRGSVLLLKVLIGELLAVDAFATGAVAASEVAALDHEVWNDTMEFGVLVVKGLSLFSLSFFSRAECSEVFRGFWHDVVVQLHYDATGSLSTNSHIEENAWTAHCL